MENAEKYKTDTAQKTFKNFNQETLQKLADVVIAKKKLEKIEKECKEKLQADMEKCNVSKVEWDLLRIIYCPATTYISVIKEKLQYGFPSVHKACTTKKEKKAHLQVKLSDTFKD